MTYSAGDIKKVVEYKKSTSKSKKIPPALQHLYMLEEMIADLRDTIDKEEEQITASETATLIEPTLPPNPYS